jgi:hypothetical protein
MSEEGSYVYSLVSIDTDIFRHRAMYVANLKFDAAHAQRRT